MKLMMLEPSGEEYARLVAEEVRSLAARKRVTGVQLAEAIGVSPQSMSRRMTGALPFSIAELASVAGLLEVEVADLLPVAGVPGQRRTPVTEGYREASEARTAQVIDLADYRAQRTELPMAAGM